MKPRTYAFVFVAIFLFSTIFVFSKKIIPPLNSFSYLFIRSMLGTIAFTILLASMRLYPTFMAALRKGWKQLILFALAMHLFPLVLVFIATPMTTATDLTIINNLNLSFVILLNWVIQKKKPTLALVGIVSINFAGAIVIMMPLDFSTNPNLVGDLVMLLAVFFGAFFPIFNKKLAQDANPFVLAYAINLFPFLALIPINLAWPGQIGTITALQPLGWFFITWIGVGVSAFAYSLGNLAYKDEGMTPELYSILTTLIPVGGIIWDVALFGTAMTIFRIMGAALVIGSVILAQVVETHVKTKEKATVIDPPSLLFFNDDEKENYKKRETG
nr:DMT family transporter [Candidatus Sigynarchaeum springense]